MSDEKLVWFDCETTGLDPKSDKILEVACVITGKDLLVLDHFEAVLSFDEDIESDWVRNQHTKSGLLDGCKVSNWEADAVESRLIMLLEKHDLTQKKGVLAGSSIHFDRGFLREHMPLLDGSLHYRMVDVSGLNELALRFAPDVYAARPTIPKEEIAHRAMPDLLASIHVLHYYLSTGLFGRAI